MIPDPRVDRDDALSPDQQDAAGSRSALTRATRFIVVVVAVCSALLILAAPQVLSGYWGRVLTFVFMWGVLAQSFNIMAGYVGYFAFGNTAFFGIGAYVVAIGSREGFPPGLMLLLAGPVAAAYCAVVGRPILRLRGHYFAIGTLALLLFTREMVVNLRGLTGGSSGIVLRPMVEGTPRDVYPTFYYLMLAVLIATTVTAWWLKRSRFGYGLVSIKADEDAAASIGIWTIRYKLAAWMLSASFAGFAGGVWAQWFTYIDPGSAFSVTSAATFSVMALLGGLGTIIGPVVGALLVEVSTEVILGSFYEYHLAVTGMAIILIVLVVPTGLVPLLRRRLPAARRYMS